MVLLPKAKHAAKSVKGLIMARESAYHEDQSKGGGGKFWPAVVGMKTGVIGGGIGAAHLMNKKEEQDAQNKREADAEMKRESRGVQKPTNFDAIQEAKQENKDAQDRKKISDMGYAGGGMTASSRADGIATKGKTRGKMV
jgi:hypothetical protein